MSMAATHRANSTPREECHDQRASEFTTTPPEIAHTNEKTTSNENKDGTSASEPKRTVVGFKVKILRFSQLLIFADRQLGVVLSFHVLDVYRKCLTWIILCYKHSRKEYVS